MAILPPRPPGTPGPFSGNLIIFGVGPRASSTMPSPSKSEAAEPSADDFASQAQGRMMEAVDAKLANLREESRSTGKP